MARRYKHTDKEIYSWKTMTIYWKNLLDLEYYDYNKLINKQLLSMVTRHQSFATYFGHDEAYQISRYLKKKMFYNPFASYLLLTL